MTSNKCQIVLILACCLIALVSAQTLHKEVLPLPLVRHERSPQPEGGSLTAGISQDQAGRQANLQYNQNLFTSRDGRGTIDAYANADRNFDHNRNDFGAGIQGRWNF